MQNKIHTLIQRIGFNKKLFFLVFPLTFLFFGVHTTHAFLGIGNLFYEGAQALLYMVFIFVGWFTSVATTMFAYVVDPQMISGPKGMLNLQAVYDMWKFVRDFINIFFILGLLFIAFAFVFQIKEYSEPKIIIKLVIAALLVNFSFPLARIIIDLANVPMYFFLQMILGDGTNASTALSSSLGASNLQGILLPSGDDSDISSLLAAIVFLFIFNITLLVLAFQFLIRLVALIILVILSPIGFVATGIPGLKKYGTQWWDNFMNYCLFGPAAMFMLVLATNFFSAISTGDSQATVGSLASQNSANPGFIASMVLFFVPITMLWFVIGMSGKFSIAGASVATDYGKKFAKWAGKTATVKPAKFIGRKADSKLASTKYGKYISPGAIKQAFKARGEYKKHQDEAPIKAAAADLHDELNKRVSQAQNIGATVLPWNWKGAKARYGLMSDNHWNTDHTEFGDAELVKQASEHAKHIAEISEDWGTNKSHVKTALLSNDSSELMGHLKVLAKNNDFNEIVPEMGLEFIAAKEHQNTVAGTDKLDANGNVMLDGQGNAIKEWVTINLAEGQSQVTSQWQDAAGNTLKKRAINVMGKTLEVTSTDASGEEKLLSDSDGAKATVAMMLRSTGMEDKKILGYMAHLGQQALGAGNGAHGNMVKRDSHGNYEMNDALTQGIYNAGKLELQDPQKIATGMHADTIFRRDSAGAYTGLNGAVAKAHMDKLFTIALGDQASRMKNTKRGFKELWDNQDVELAQYYDSAGEEQKYAIAKIMYQAGVWADNPQNVGAFKAQGVDTFAAARIKYP